MRVESGIKVKKLRSETQKYAQPCKPAETNLKSVVPKGTCPFESDRGHHLLRSWRPSVLLLDLSVLESAMLRADGPGPPFVSLMAALGPVYWICPSSHLRCCERTGRGHHDVLRVMVPNSFV